MSSQISKGVHDRLWGEPLEGASQRIVTGPMGLRLVLCGNTSLLPRPFCLYMKTLEGRAPLEGASQRVVTGLLRQDCDGLLQAHVEAQPLAHVVPHLLVAAHAPPNLSARRLQKGHTPLFSSVSIKELANYALVAILSATQG